MSAVPAAPSAPEVTSTPAPEPSPQVEETSTPAPGEVAPETPVSPGTEGEESQEQRAELPEKWQEHPDIAAYTTEQVTKVKAEAEKALEFRLAQQHTDLTTERQRAVDLAKADKVVLSAAEAFAAAKKGFTEGFDDPDEGLKEFKKLMSETDNWARVYADDLVSENQTIGTQKGIYEASQVLYEGLSEDAHKDLAHYVVTDLNKRFVDGKMTQIEVYKAMREKRDELLLADHERKIAPTIEERVKAEAKAAENAAEPGPVKVAGRSAGGGPQWSTKMEARTLHVQNKISNAEMKAINADPSIPEM